MKLEIVRLNEPMVWVTLKSYSQFVGVPLNDLKPLLKEPYWLIDETHGIIVNAHWVEEQLFNHNYKEFMKIVELGNVFEYLKSDEFVTTPMNLSSIHNLINHLEIRLVKLEMRCYNEGNS